MRGPSARTTGWTHTCVCPGGQWVHRAVPVMHWKDSSSRSALSCGPLTPHSPGASLLSKPVQRGQKTCRVVVGSCQAAWRSLLGPTRVIPALIMLLTPALAICLGDHVFYVFEGGVAGISWSNETVRAGDKCTLAPLRGCSPWWGRGSGNTAHKPGVKIQLERPLCLTPVRMGCEQGGTAWVETRRVAPLIKSRLKSDFPTWGAL